MPHAGSVQSSVLEGSRPQAAFDGSFSVTGFSCFHHIRMGGTRNLFYFLVKHLTRSVDAFFCPHLLEEFISWPRTSHLASQKLSLLLLIASTDKTISISQVLQSWNTSMDITMFWKALQICIIIITILLDFLSPVNVYELHLIQEPTPLS